jgi:hypothetical protein
MRFDPGSDRIFVRQSWLGDALICPQRSRYALAMPTMRRGSDATAIGTGVHAGIEQYLTGNVGDLDAFIEVVHTTVSAELDKDIKLTGLTDDMSSMWACVDNMSTGWWNNIRPSVVPGGLVEHKFQAPLGVHATNGYGVWLEGTIDYVAPDGSLWDWKTAGRTYFAKEKQTQSHQATCYITACRRLGLIPDEDAPSIFRFGVMVRQASAPKTQIVTVTRGKDQVEWFKRQVLSVVNTAIGSWGVHDWPMNDQHNLCSSKWCDYWSVCKGAHWREADLSLPDQSVDNPAGTA